MAGKSKSTATQFIRSIALVGAISTLSACSDQPSTNANTASSSGEVSLSLFSGAYAIRALNLDNIFANVSINGDVTRLDTSEDIPLSIEVDDNDTLTLIVEWYESFSGEELLLGTYTFSEIITANRTLEIEDDDYVTFIQQGDSLDVDNDGFSNLEERVNDSNPLDVGSTPDNLPDVRIKRIAAANAPVINGRYEDAWDSAEFDDTSGIQLDVDNLMINQGAIRPDGQDDGFGKMRWFAMHDDINLYLFVLGENIDIANVVRDSGNAVSQDDALNIYLDGDNSKGQSYDGVDDRHIQIPLAFNGAGGFEDNNSDFVAGANSAALPAFDFHTCVCTVGQHTWEVSIPMAAFGISPNSLFGIDIQIDNDHDGTLRDAKWGWFHPSRANDTDTDNTWINPSFMGIAIASDN